MPHFEYEERLQLKNFSRICGIDEAGRGPLAGPVVAAACFFEEKIELPYLSDSKKLSESRREALYKRLTEDPLIHSAVALIEPRQIDELNILQATLLAMKLAFEKLNKKISIDYALIDGDRSPTLLIPTKTLIGGDGISASIAAASILAKVTRDRLMIEYDAKWPEYGFAKHKGYGTKFHKEAIEKFGPCPIHRFSFSPLSSNFFSLCEQKS